MATTSVSLRPDEIARRGDEIYARDLRGLLEPQHVGEIVAIDITTGAHSIGATTIDAGRTLRAQHPQAVVWLIRIGHPTLHRIGGALQMEGVP